MLPENQLGQDLFQEDQSSRDLIPFLQANKGVSLKALREQFPKEAARAGHHPERLFRAAGLLQGKNYLPAVLESRKAILLGYLRSHPDARQIDLVEEGLLPHLKAYGGNLNRARQAAGIPPVWKNTLPADEIRKRKEKICAYLRAHPHASHDELIQLGYRRYLQTCYGDRINKARKDAGVPLRPSARQQTEKKLPLNGELDPEYQREQLLAYLRNHPRAGKKSIYHAGHGNALRFCYDDDLHEARIDAGLRVRVIDLIHFDTLGYLQRGVQSVFLDYIIFLQDQSIRLGASDLHARGFGPVFDQFYGGDIEAVYTDAQRRRQELLLESRPSFCSAASGVEW